jgi:hypothetical protein
VQYPQNLESPGIRTDLGDDKSIAIHFALRQMSRTSRRRQRRQNCAGEVAENKALKTVQPETNTFSEFLDQDVGDGGVSLQTHNLPGHAALDRWGWPYQFRLREKNPAQGHRLQPNSSECPSIVYSFR